MGNLTRWSFLHFAILAVVLLLLTLLPSNHIATAQEISAAWYEVRSIRMDEYGLSSLQGFAFLPAADTFLVWDGNGQVTGISMHEDHVDTTGMSVPMSDSLNIAFSDQKSSLYLLDQAKAELTELNINQNDLTNQDTAAIRRFYIHAVGLTDAKGITFDPDNGNLFVLDAKSAQIIVIAPDSVSGFEGSIAVNENRVKRIALNKPNNIQLQGIAFNPVNKHLYLWEPAQHKLYELTGEGQEVSTYDLSKLHLAKPGAMLFAPSADATDDPATMDLFIQDSSQIVELSLKAPATLPSGTPLLHASLVQIIDTSNKAWNPSAPDPAGVDYWPITNRLLIVDSEVDEMPSYFTGKNAYLSITGGNLAGTCSTTSFTNEPTGVGINPSNNHIFISTDFNDSIFEVSLGPDGTYCTADDSVTTTDVSTLYHVNDAEDVAYGNNTVFVAGGVDAEVYRIPLGPNGVLGGGDDGPMTHFDTAGWGFHDLEGIGYNADHGTLFIVSTQGTEHYLGETSQTGTFLRAYDLSLMGTDANIRSDVSYAPSSQNPAVKSIYIASRGIDNNSNRKENDGRFWEINISGTATFSDVPTNYWAYSAIEQVYAAGITGGCATNPLRYCPETLVTRAQMAVFLERSMKGPSYTPPPATGTVFADVPSSYWAATWIERLAVDRITGGCSSGYYCPENPVTRAQMAVFLLRARHGASYTPPAVGASTSFNDIPITYWAAAWIKQLAVEGITQGCGNGNYCPESPVTRAEMAVFLVATFNF